MDTDPLFLALHAPRGVQCAGNAQRMCVCSGDEVQAHMAGAGGAGQVLALPPIMCKWGSTGRCGWAGQDDEEHSILAFLVCTPTLHSLISMPSFSRWVGLPV